MDAFDDTSLALMKFGVGQPVSRKEDPILLRGEGRYTDDINLPGQVHAVMVRSPVAHGRLKGVDTKAASAMPGVLAILTHADLEAAGFGPLKCAINIPQRDGSPMKTPPRPCLAIDRVRFVGEAGGPGGGPARSHAPGGAGTSAVRTAGDATRPP